MVEVNANIKLPILVRGVKLLDILFCLRGDGPLNSCSPQHVEFAN